MKSSKNSVEEHAALFLRRLYELTRKGFTKVNIQSLISECHTSTNLWTVLREHDYVKVQKDGDHKLVHWAVGEPNLQMVRTIRILANDRRKTAPKRKEGWVKNVDVLIQEGDQVKTLSRSQFDKLVMKEVNKRLLETKKNRRRFILRSPIIFRNPIKIV